MKVDTFFSLSLINLFLFLMPAACFFTIVSKLFNEKTNKIITVILVFLICLLFNIHFIYKAIFNVYFSFSLIKLADQAVSFWKSGLIGILKNIIGVILLFLPVIFIIVFNKKMDFSKSSLKELIVIFEIGLGGYILFLSSLYIKKEDSYSPNKLYYNINNNSLNIEKLGIMNSTSIDLYRIIFGFNEDIEIPVEVDKSIETKYGYNITDIDFDKLYEKEKDDVVKSMHQYFASETGTLKNEYTGYYQNKNLILFMAESFNEIAVSEELTPTLYKLVNSSFVFNNFYTPVNNSTIGGEFQELTGLFANNAILSKWRSGTNSFPYGIANIFKDIDYMTYAYHDNFHTFQSRNKYLKALGFDNFKACKNGLEKLINCKQWPESDVEMINATVNDYINDEHFMVFYATVSGHGEYNWGNAMSKKHKSAVEKLIYSDKVKAYIASQIELDQALELLINKLEENGRLEDTVIALVGDHYPYYLTLDEVNEAADYKKDSIIEINRSNFILWNSKTPTKQIDKVGSEIDVLPTIYNLFGIDYDSRLIVGKDILSTEPGLAIFADRSWVSDYGSYFAKNTKFVPKNVDDYSQDYVDDMNKIVANKVNISKLIIEKDYYRKVEE